ncbi:MAG: SPFH domain-containing protein [Phycisphaerales bacterium]
MSTNDPTNLGGDIDPAQIEMPVESPRRAASLTLRSEDVRQARAASMELANKSLGDALKLTYRLLQVLMLVLLALFAFSGVRKIDQAERGVRTTLGKLDASDLEPGVHFSLPYPLGQIVQVSTAQNKLDLDESFYPFLSKDDRLRPPGELGMGGALRPGTDGSLITGDSNLAHARFGVAYHRDNPSAFVQSLADGAESSLVRAVVERAAVRVIAEISLDDILKRNSANLGTAGGAGSVGSEIEDRVRRTAQSALDEMNSGLRIDSVSLRDETPPLWTRQSYQAVQTAESKAATDRENAEKDRAKLLNEAAGAAYPLVLGLIDEYERQIDSADNAGAEKTLEVLQGLMDGSYKGGPITINGQAFEPVKVEGRSAALISEAESYRSTVERSAQTRAAGFTAKREQFLANPRVFVTREWSEAMREFLNSPIVESQFIPGDTAKYVLRLSADPEIAKAMQAAEQRRKMEENPAYRRALGAGLLPAEQPK